MLSRSATTKLWALAWIISATGISVLAETAGDQELNAAYKALAAKNYDAAVGSFRQGLMLQPKNARVHKDLAYTLLKTGDNAEARDEFETAIHLNENDETAQLEYAFLCYETKKPLEARRTFARLRKSTNPTTRATAEQAFQNIDGPLAANIERWKQALARAPNPNSLPLYSAHWELAETAELRDDLPLAVEQYEICRQLKPGKPDLLLALARVWRQLNQVEEANAAVLAASRSTDARTAELALAGLGPRYPYPYEFEKALILDPKNTNLRGELGYLYLAMHKDAEAIRQFEQVLAIEPNNQKIRDQVDALHGFTRRTETVRSSVDARTMGLKSLALGYTKDAIKYLQQAHEQNPSDEEVILKLGWAYNSAKRDDEALRWFDQARSATDPAIAAEASKAFHNLKGDTPQTTVWTQPIFSTRWKDAFIYGQVKRTLPLPWAKANKLFLLYLSARFEGDMKDTLQQSAKLPPDLSQNSVIFAAGAATRPWHHLMAWGEAGESVGFLPGISHDRLVPAYQGGLDYGKGFGTLLGSSKAGFFYETNADAKYTSRFDKDWQFISQNRAGRTFQVWGNSAQMLFNFNAEQDTKHEYWSDLIEMGPGVRLHLPWMAPNVYLATDFLRGVYTNNVGNPHRPNYNDVKISLWYALTKQ